MSAGTRSAHLAIAPLVVSIEGAARLLNTSEDKVRQLLRAGLIAEVPHLSSKAKKSIAVAELERFVRVSVMSGPDLRAVGS